MSRSTANSVTVEVGLVSEVNAASRAVASGEWRTSKGPNGKAHFWFNGKPACGHRRGIWPGVILADLFTRPTVPATPEDHRCHYCRLLVSSTYGKDVVCTCWSCKTKAAGGLRP